jgi:hypothetical protein
MPMRYAHREDVLHQCELDPEDPEHEGDILRVERLENGLCLAFDQKVGHSFGVDPLPETRVVQGLGTDLLALGYPGARAIASIAVGGRWDGVSWLDETLLLPTDWMRMRAERDGEGSVVTIRLMDGIWTGSVRVTAVWADQTLKEVPDDVREALTWLTVEEYRTRNASPAGFIGPEGLMIPTRNPWNFQLVKSAIAHHRVRRQRVGV